MPSKLFSSRKLPADRRKDSSARSVSSASAGARSLAFSCYSVSRGTQSAHSVRGAASALSGSPSSAVQALLERNVGGGAAASGSTAAYCAQRVRVQAYKEMNHRIALLGSNRQKLQRVLAECAREASKLEYATRSAHEVRALLANTNATLRSELMAVSKLQATLSGSSTSLRSLTQAAAASAAAASHKDPNQSKPPFTMYESQLSVYRQQATPTSCGLRSGSRSPSPGGVLAAVQPTAATTLTAKETAVVYERSALLEALGEYLDSKCEAAAVLRQEMAEQRLRVEHMRTLIDRALDAEVQVLRGAFPQGDPTTGRRLIKHSNSGDVMSEERRNLSLLLNPADNRGESSSERLTKKSAKVHGQSAGATDVYFVNASPIFPEMRVQDFDAVFQRMESLNVAAVELYDSVRRAVCDARVKTVESSACLKKQLAVGVKQAHTKLAASKLALEGARREEQHVLSKKHELLAFLDCLQKRLHDVERSVVLRSELGLEQAGGEGPREFDLVSRSPTSAEGTVNSDRGADAVTHTLLLEREALQAQIGEAVGQLAQIDAMLRRVGLEKKHMKRDFYQSRARSESCSQLMGQVGGEDDHSSIAQNLNRSSSSGKKREGS